MRRGRAGTTPAAIALRDLSRDWRRWSRAERAAAVAILAVSLSGLPAYLVLNGL